MNGTIRIKVFPALNGDCFLLTYGQDHAKHILIDCGYTDTFKTFLKDQLLEIARRGEHLERLIITHIDSDHISGALALFKENQQVFVRINQVWHNTYRHLRLQAAETGDLERGGQQQILQNIMARGYYREREPNPHREISAGQGTTIGAYLLKGHYSWNEDFDYHAVSVDNRQEIAIDEWAQVRLLSPDDNKLRELGSFWKKELSRLGIGDPGDKDGIFDDAFEMMLSWEREGKKGAIRKISSGQPPIEELAAAAFKEDMTRTNGSSIAFVLEIKGKKLLFLADAHPGLIEENLGRYSEEGTIYFDCIKVAHHGSHSNTSPSLLRKIDSKVYLFSTNGKTHDHPDRETIARVVGRPAAFSRNLYFNYKTSNSEYFNNPGWMNEYRYTINYLDQAPYELIL